MPTTIFDWAARTAMLAMAGLVTLSILGAVAAMTNDPGTRFFAAPGDRPVIEGEPVEAQEARTAPGPTAGEKLSTAAEGIPGSAGTSAPAPAPDERERWLEAIAYALMALVGIGILAILMLWSIVRELRRIERPAR